MRIPKRLGPKRRWLAASLCLLGGPMANACDDQAGCRTGHTKHQPTVSSGDSSHRRSNVIAIDAGDSYRLSGGNYGDSVGSVLIHFGKVQIECDIELWSRDEIEFRVAPLRLRQPARGVLDVRNSAGDVAMRQTVQVNGIEVQIIDAVQAELSSAGVIVDPPQIVPPDQMQLAPSAGTLDLPEAAEESAEQNQ